MFFMPLNLARCKIHNIELLHEIYYSFHINVCERRKAWKLNLFVLAAEAVIGKLDV